MASLFLVRYLTTFRIMAVRILLISSLLFGCDKLVNYSKFDGVYEITCNGHDTVFEWNDFVGESQPTSITVDDYKEAINIISTDGPIAELKVYGITFTINLERSGDFSGRNGYGECSINGHIDRPDKISFNMSCINAQTGEITILECVPQ